MYKGVCLIFRQIDTLFLYYNIIFQAVYLAFYQFLTLLETHRPARLQSRVNYAKLFKYMI